MDTLTSQYGVGLMRLLIGCWCRGTCFWGDAAAVWRTGRTARGHFIVEGRGCRIVRGRSLWTRFVLSCVTQWIGHCTFYQWPTSWLRNISTATSTKTTTISTLHDPPPPGHPQRPRTATASQPQQPHPNSTVNSIHPSSHVPLPACDDKNFPTRPRTPKPEGCPFQPTTNLQPTAQPSPAQPSPRCWPCASPGASRPWLDIQSLGSCREHRCRCRRRDSPPGATQPASNRPTRLFVLSLFLYIA